MPRIDVCLTPELIHRYDLENKIVIVADILRATSCMITAFAHGANHILPTTQHETCRQMKPLGYITACEKDGRKVPGFDKGNSPLEYMGNDIKGAKIAFKTTNGTQALELAKKAPVVLVGAFLNLEAITHYIEQEQRDILVFCAGWQGEINMEDTLFAGAVVEALQHHATPHCDAPIITQNMYRSAQNDMLSFLSASSHFQRLKRLGHYEDIVFCMKKNQYPIIPMLRDNILIC